MGSTGSGWVRDFSSSTGKKPFSVILVDQLFQPCRVIVVRVRTIPRSYHVSPETIGKVFYRETSTGCSKAEILGEDLAG